MPVASFGTEHKVQRAYDYPKLFLDRGERARVVIIEDSPTFEYVHTLKKPLIVNGVVVMETVKTQSGQEQRPKEDFVGRYLCNGEVDVLQKNGKDVKNCVLCEESEKGDAIWGPQRRWVVHIIRYNLKPGSFEVQEPYGVTVQAWAFSDKIFNTIVDLSNEWCKGDKKLRDIDLMLGPCEVKQFQKFDINVAASSEWLEDDDRKKGTVLAFRENKSEDLVPLLGRKVTEDVMREKADEINAAVRVLNGGGGPTAPTDTPSAVELQTVVDLDALTADVPADDAPPAVPAEKAEAPAAPAAEAGTKDDGENLDFDDLLNSL